ncbi:MAG: hypothetical protein NHF93_00335 [Candidatus Shikimatogenerans bostrichidophilus]|nr:MAG: hypothetical protein NHF93_00335 [Candidatus Shikimatogenerans bostrichidophilus]
MKKNIFDISLLSKDEKIKFYINKNFFKLFIYNKEDFLNPKINLILKKKNKNNLIILKFYFKGIITLFCDITNNKFIFKIKKKKKLNIMFGKKKIEEENNYLILPFYYKKINISKYIYESIILMLPFKKIDPKIKKKYIKNINK